MNFAMEMTKVSIMISPRDNVYFTLITWYA